MAEQPLKDLVRKRGYVKAQITILVKFLDDFKNDDSLANLSIDKVNRRVDVMKKAFSKFEDICDGLEKIDEEHASEHNDERFIIQDRYLTALDGVEDLTTRLAAKNKPIDLSSLADVTMIPNNDNTLANVCGADHGESNISNIDQHVETHNNNVQINDASNDINFQNNSTDQIQLSRPPRGGYLKLPESKLPTFDGSYENFIEFRNNFMSMIGNRNDISRVQKLQYLKTALKGEASHKIANILITDENYERAWSVIMRAYYDERLIKSKHLSLLLKIPKQQHDSAEGLQRLADETQQHVESLKSLGVVICDEILIQNIENKLCKSTADKWEETLKRGMFPKLDEMYEFLYKTAARLKKRNEAEHSASNNKPKLLHNSNNKNLNSNKKQTFLTSVGGNCPACKEKHLLFRCKLFKQMTIPKRRELVNQASLCVRCLRKHETEDCKIKKCLVCDRSENLLLHEHVNKSD